MYNYLIFLMIYYCSILCSTFVVEQKHGFNKSTLLLFFQDKLMSLSLLLVLSMPILSVVIWLVRLGGEYFYFYVWTFLLVVRYLMSLVNCRIACSDDKSNSSGNGSSSSGASSVIFWFQ